MKIIVAITGGSGMIYARQCLDALLATEQVEQIALIVSATAEQVLSHEAITLPSDTRIVRFGNDNMFSSVASGSASWDTMIIVPASMGTVGRIAAGISSSLIERAADVMFKERHRLIAVVREAPYSLIHLRNMTTITEAGGIIIPASPSFYSRPESIEQLAATITERVIAQAGIAMPHYEFEGKEVKK